MRCLRTEQVLPVGLDEAWDFFATPHNLNRITPPQMVFRITSAVPEKMYEGLMITYVIQPMLRIPMDWCTEITHIREGEYFVDEQRKGPYRIWHHEHHFRAVPGGVLMTDILHYDIGKSVFGWLAGQLFVHRQVDRIFRYRRQALEQIFPKPAGI